MINCVRACWDGTRAQELWVWMSGSKWMRGDDGDAEVSIDDTHTVALPHSSTR